MSTKDNDDDPGIMLAENVTGKVVGNKVFLVADLPDEQRISSTGKTALYATCSGGLIHDDTMIRISLNITRSPTVMEAAEFKAAAIVAEKAANDALKAAQAATG